MKNCSIDTKSSVPDDQRPLEATILGYLQELIEVSQAEAAALMPLMEWRRFDKKEIITAAGELENYLNLVLSGLVRKFITRGNNEYTLQLATEGHIVHSEISYLRREPSVVQLEALEPTLLLSLSYDHMQYALDHLPGADRMGRMLITCMLLKKDERQIRQLRLSTRQRFLDYLQNHPHMLQRVPQKYLASYLNIKPETFSRLKHLLRGK